MKKWIKIAIILTIICSIAVSVPYFSYITKAQYTAAPEDKKFIKWLEFNVPYSALKKAIDEDIKSWNTATKISFIETLAYLAVKYGGNWKQYKSGDMDKLFNLLK